LTRKDDTTSLDTGQPKVLYFDIETAPNLSYVWAQWEQNVLAHEREWYMLCFSYQWEHEGKTRVVAQDDFKNHRKDPFNDNHVIEELWKLLDEADIVVGHNLDKFDIRKANARFIQLGHQPPSPYKTIDTLKIARASFMFNSNRLGDLCRLLGIGDKHETGGFGLWMGCMEGDPKAWKKMKKYAKQDTALLPDIYKALRPWAKSHHSMNLYGAGPDACPRCGAVNPKYHRRGYHYTKSGRFVKYQCQTCKGYCHDRLSNKEADKPNRVV